MAGHADGNVAFREAQGLGVVPDLRALGAFAAAVSGPG
jgi:hypothetical protein